MRSVKWCVLALVFACGGGNGSAPDDPAPDVTPTPEPEDALSIARTSFPRMMDMHAGVIQKTCSPNPNVCHNNNNYPDLQTVGALASTLNAPCNIEMPDPKDGYDACERIPDRLVVGAFSARIAWVQQIDEATWTIELRRPVDAPIDGKPIIEDADGQQLFNPPAGWGLQVSVPNGSSTGTVTATSTDIYVLETSASSFASVIGGDPNRNGVFGAVDTPVPPPATMVAPGSLATSYLWGRLTGTVPGFRMPLANGPVRNPQYIALACWIEGLSADRVPAASDEIDYDGCAFAQDPVDYENE